MASQRGFRLGMVFSCALLTGLLGGVARGAQVYPTFTTSETGTGAGPDAVAIGNFNGDAYDDIAIANADGDSVTIFLGTSGGFPSSPSQAITSAAINQPRGIALGDFNNDSNVDIAVSNYTSDFVCVFLGNGDGTFQSGLNKAVSPNPLGLAVGYLDGDANLDIAVVTRATSSTSGNVTILLGNGNGTFLPPVDKLVGSKPQFLAIGDFGTNAGVGGAVRDGTSDIAVTLSGSHQVKVLFNQGGTAQFSSSATFAAGQGPKGIVAAELNNDLNDCLDLATANDDGGVSTVQVLIGTCAGTGSFLGARQVATFSSASNTYNLAAIELNADTKLDLAVTNTGGSGTANDKVALLVNQTPDGNTVPSFAAPVLCAADNGPTGLAVGNLNPAADPNNVVPDLAVANRKGDVVTLLNGPFGSCPTPIALGGSLPKDPVAMVACDILDASGTAGPDGKVDLVILDQEPPESVQIYTGNGLGSFSKTKMQTLPSSSAHAGTSIACGDLNGDTKNDLLVSNAGGDDNIVRCLYSAPASFICVNLLNGQNNPTSSRIADLNGSGNLDYGFVNEGGDTAYLAGQVVGTGISPKGLVFGVFNSVYNDAVVAPSGSTYLNIYLNGVGPNPQGTFSSTPLYGLGTNGSGTLNKPWNLTGTDLDGDLKADVVTANKNQKSATVAMGVGGGAFAAPATFWAGNDPVALVTSDFNLDGYVDVVAADETKDNAVVLLGSGSGVPSTILFGCETTNPSCNYAVGDAPIAVVTGKFDADTKPDLALLNSNTGSISILLNTSEAPCPCPPCP